MASTRDRSGGRLAQLVERFPYTEDVGGSSPSAPTIPVSFITKSALLFPKRAPDCFRPSSGKAKEGAIELRLSCLSRHLDRCAPEPSRSEEPLRCLISVGSGDHNAGCAITCKLCERRIEQHPTDTCPTRRIGDDESTGIDRLWPMCRIGVRNAPIADILGRLSCTRKQTFVHLPVHVRFRPIHSGR